MFSRQKRLLFIGLIIILFGAGAPAAPGEKPCTEVLEIDALQSLMVLATSSAPEKYEARKKAQVLLGLDDLNFSYFLALVDRQLHRGENEIIYLDDGVATRNLVAYSASLAPPELRGQFKYVDFNDLQKGNYARFAKGATLWQKKLNAGSGSSLTRSTYLKTKLGQADEIKLENGEVRLGAKATDLFVELGLYREGHERPEVSLAEVQILQALQNRFNFGGYVISDVVGPETVARVKALWQKRFFFSSRSSTSYETLVKQSVGLSHFTPVYQSFVPSLRADGSLSTLHSAPAGHGLFAVDALRAVLHPELRPTVKGPLVLAISNGEDPNSSADPAVVGWMVREKIPITLITTEKTNIDKKGGLLCLVKNKDTGEVFLKVLETAEAKAAGQQKLFESLGGYASTNLTLFNYDALDEKLKSIPEDELMKIIAPDVIRNPKTKIINGTEETFTQLEGAMGSTIMNLDRYWRRTHGEPLVYIVNVDREHRTEMFSPIKTAFDYFMQFHSDRFKFETFTMRLRNMRPGTLPIITLADPVTHDKFYQDVQNVLDVFKGTQILKLDELEIQGQVNLAGLRLEGKVHVINETGKLFDLALFASTHPELKLANVEVHVDQLGQVTLRR